ncbi:hypothetical protein M011DRAFT_277037 [Sporormia fimetaria CBS 119925]|uniref:Uncharacterized protein n=1 Tax=Sporormia fimetaria CBS 119925 TaxID=1340428 RepID=A0A6A6VJS0_9PLEO|nr:hypothetical protein M011DRAFT_277037 [Sporormia fimetaria CBS 119925]
MRAGCQHGVKPGSESGGCRTGERADDVRPQDVCRCRQAEDRRPQGRQRRDVRLQRRSACRGGVDEGWGFVVVVLQPLLDEYLGNARRGRGNVFGHREARTDAQGLRRTLFSRRWARLAAVDGIAVDDWHIVWAVRVWVGWMRAAARWKMQL